MTSRHKQMNLTTKQIESAIRYHEQGITWSIVSALLKTNPTSLRKAVKTYEQQSNNNKRD